MDDELRQVLEAMQRDNAAAHGETRRHFDIVAEQLGHELRIVAEGVGSSSERIDRLEAQVAKVADNLDARESPDVPSVAGFQPAGVHTAAGFPFVANAVRAKPSSKPGICRPSFT
jgi:hypothetical protein